MELEKSLLAIPNQDSCELLNSEIENSVQESKEMLAVRNKEFDKHDGKLSL